MLRPTHSLVRDNNSSEIKTYLSQFNNTKRISTEHNAQLNNVPKQTLVSDKSITEKISTSIQCVAHADDFLELNELKRLIDSVIACIQLNQASALITEEAQTPIWVTDLSMHDGKESGVVELRISYEKQNSKEEERK